ncbi:MAG TPA: hypothetical protein VLN74_08760 [Ilumatobacteraceae bacterium]|nr:hypothetical protein [Ilumatobacteraceae bacterium]
MCLHPDGLAAATVNFVEWSVYLLRQLRRTIVLTGDEGLIALESEVLAYPNVARIARRTATDGGEELRILDELAVELFVPADDTTEAALRAPNDNAVRDSSAPRR